MTLTVAIPRSSKDVRILPCLLALFAMSNFYFGLHFLDDAFIHLRYAESLATTGVIQYNPGQPGYGTSSPLFVYVLAALVRVGIDSIWITKVVSVLLHLVLVLQFFKITQGASGRVKHLMLAVTMLLAMPMSARWMANGMETSMVAVLAVCLGQLLLRGSAQAGCILTWCVAYLLACVARPEFFPIAMVAALILVIERRGRERLYPLAGLILGVGLALTQYMWVFGHVTPDTAIAKSAGFSLIRGLTTFPQSTLSTVFALISSSTLGIAMALILALGTHGAYARGPVRAKLIVALLAFLGLIFMIAARGQAIQGVRYFVFIVFFIAPLAAWHDTTLDASEHPPNRSTSAHDTRPNRRLTALVFAVFLLDGVLCWPIVEGRSQTTLKFIHQPFADASNRPCVGYDIGYFSYFSGCRIHDMAGLVNGREAAMLSPQQRLQSLKGIPFQLAFLNDAQLLDLEKAGVLNRNQYQVIERFEFPNINNWVDGKRDTHYLMKVK